MNNFSSYYLKMHNGCSNKFLFIEEKKGTPMKYTLSFKYENHVFNATYKIGSKDGKSRSGILILDSYFYKNILKIKANDRLRISKIDKTTYTITKL